MTEISPLDQYRLDLMMDLATTGQHLPVVDDSGKHPVVVALDEERLAVLLGRIRAVGGYANVFSSDGTRTRCVAFIDTKGALDTSSALDMANVPEIERPGVNASVGMFIDLLEVHPGGVVVGALGHGSVSAPTAIASRDLVSA